MDRRLPTLRRHHQRAIKGGFRDRQVVALDKVNPLVSVSHNKLIGQLKQIVFCLSVGLRTI